MIEENAVVSVFYFSFEISIACSLLSRPNLRIVSKLTTDVVTYRYCTEASNQKSKYAYRKIFFYKKALPLVFNYFDIFAELTLIVIIIILLIIFASWAIFVKALRLQNLQNKGHTKK